MSSPYLEAAAIAEQERDNALEELAGVTRQRDELKRQLVLALDEIVRLTKQNAKYETRDE